MSVKVEMLEGNKAKLSFVVEKEKFIEEMDKVYTQNAKYFAIPGFRKGKVPKQMVEKYYGIQVFYQDAFENIANEIYPKAVEENNLKVVSKPEIDVEKMSKEEGLVFSATVDLEPVVTLGEYKGIKLDKIEYNVTDKDVEEKIESVAKENARIITAEEGELKNGDISNIDFEGFVNGVAFEGGKGEKFDLEIGSGSFIPGFEDQLVGMKIGEEREINVRFPDEYHSEELKGKDAMFKVKLNGFKVKELPTIDDEFAKDVSEFDTLEEYKADLRKHMEEDNEHRAKHELESKALEKVVENTPIDIPQSMIEMEVNAKLEEIKHNMKHQGIDFNMYLNMIGQKEDDVKIQLEDQAIKDIKVRLVLQAIINEEKIEVTDEDIEKKIEELAKMRNQDVEDFKKTFSENIRNYYKENMKFEKAMQFIIDNAKIK